MSKVPSPYCIETESGKLELMKGAYLTLLKRKSSTIRTMEKSKPICHFGNKKTVKKNMTSSYGRSYLASKNEVLMKDKKKNNLVFSVFRDRELFESRVAIPIIDMADDNDNES